METAFASFLTSCLIHIDESPFAAHHKAAAHPPCPPPAPSAEVSPLTTDRRRKARGDDWPPLSPPQAASCHCPRLCSQRRTREPDTVSDDARTIPTGSLWLMFRLFACWEARRCARAVMDRRTGFVTLLSQAQTLSLVVEDRDQDRNAPLEYSRLRTQSSGFRRR